MQLRQLACNDYVLRSPEDRLDIGESVQNTVGRFIKNMRDVARGHLASDELFERGLPLARFGWKKAVEGESFYWEPTRDQAADGSIRAGNREDADSGSDGGGGDLSSRVGNSWGTGIADDGNSGAQLQLCDELLCT